MSHDQISALPEDDRITLAAALRIAIAKMDADSAVASLIYDKNRMHYYDTARDRFEALLNKIA